MDKGPVLIVLFMKEKSRVWVDSPLESRDGDRVSPPHRGVNIVRWLVPDVFVGVGVALLQP